MLAEPPSNGEYLAAAYVVGTIILVGYWFRLWIRAGAARPEGPAGKGEKRERGEAGR